MALGPKEATFYVQPFLNLSLITAHSLSEDITFKIQIS